MTFRFRIHLACGIGLMLACCSYAFAEPPGVGVSELSAARLFPSAEENSLPVNLELPSGFDNWAHDIWRRSPTFRRQCHRLKATPGWHVRVSVRPQLSGMRAHTEFRRASNGDMTALVELGFQGTQLVELLGHELEHVIEQIDGIDLAQLARQGAHGVTGRPAQHYETARAVAAGLKVAAEFKEQP
jgi:hypothetical protein